MQGHALVPMLTNPELRFPYLVLLASGGHTLVGLVEGIGKCTVLATTLDDSLGEAYDKVGRLLQVSQHVGPDVLARSAYSRAAAVDWLCLLILLHFLRAWLVVAVQGTGVGLLWRVTLAVLRR